MTTSSFPKRDPDGRLVAGLATVYLVVFWLAVFCFRLAGPFDVENQWQSRTTAYVLDIVANGHWVVQNDDEGLVMLKPPLYNWVTAVFCLIWGKVSQFPLYLTGALSCLAIALIIRWLVAARYGQLAGLLSAVAFLASWFGTKMTGYVRVDGLFALLVLLSAIQLVRCLRGRGSWYVFWFAMSLAMLTKGPLALLLVLGAPLFLTKRSGWEGFRSLLHNRSFQIGALICIAVNLGWFAAASLEGGSNIGSEMIRGQLVRHATKGFFHNLLGAPEPAFYLLMRLFPWSIPAVVGIWWLWRHRGELGEKHSLELISAGMVVFGVVAFGIFPHRSPDHVFPLAAFACILAGVTMARWLRRLNRRAVNGLLAAAPVFTLLGIVMQNHQTATESKYRETLAGIIIANQLEETFGDDPPITLVDAPISLQLSLQRLLPETSAENARDAIESPLPAYVVVDHPEKFLDTIAHKAHPHLILSLRTSADDTIGIVSNRAMLLPSDDSTFFSGNLRVDARDMTLDDATEEGMIFVPTSPAASLSMLLTGGVTRSIDVSAGAETLTRRLIPSRRTLLSFGTISPERQ